MILYFEQYRQCDTQQFIIFLIIYLVNNQMVVFDTRHFTMLRMLSVSGAKEKTHVVSIR